jgi:hypothetical protein
MWLTGKMSMNEKAKRSSLLWDTVIELAPRAEITTESHIETFFVYKGSQSVIPQSRKTMHRFMEEHK